MKDLDNAKMIDRLLRAKLGTSSFHMVFLKINTSNPVSTIQWLEIDYD